MGWEDIWAIVAFVCGMLNVVSDWVCLVEWGEHLAFLGLLSKLKQTSSY